MATKLSVFSGQLSAENLLAGLIRMLANSRLARPWIGWVFAHMNRIIPVRRLYDTETLIAFHHPNPAYPFHVLLVPKKAVAALSDLDPKDTAFLSDLYSAVQYLVRQFHLNAYRLIVNGGEYQDFPQLHFHLISDG